MKTYAKGYRAERELLRFLTTRGYSCIRAASSGGFHTPADLVAIKGGRILCFEIKAWARKPKLEKAKLESFSSWCRNAQGMGFLAWYNKNTWLFLHSRDAEDNNYDDEKWIDLNTFLKVFT